MNNVVQGFKNINFLSKSQYDSVDNPSNNELWLVEVETYRDDDGNWYRIYPDGWCEQGGIINTNSDAAYTLTLLKPYINTIYQIRITRKTTGDYNSTINGRWAEVYNVTKNSFVTWGKYSSYTEVYWEAKGYIS